MTKLEVGELKNKKYFTQKELAQRWCVSEGTIINLRKAQRVPFFEVPGSNKILYPVDGIIESEQQNTTTIKEEESKQYQPTELQLRKPVVSTKSTEEWRI